MSTNVRTEILAISHPTIVDAERILSNRKKGYNTTIAWEAMGMRWKTWPHVVLVLAAMGVSSLFVSFLIHSDGHFESARTLLIVGCISATSALVISIAMAILYYRVKKKKLSPDDVDRILQSVFKDQLQQIFKKELATIQYTDFSKGLYHQNSGEKINQIKSELGI